MERRDFIAGMGTLAAAAAAAVAVDGVARADHHKDHGKGAAGGARGGKKPMAPDKPMPKELQQIIATTTRCLERGELCLAHCTDNLAAGDTSMADCQRGVMNMLAVCEATFRAASYRSADPKSLKALARVCADFCRACAKACEPHAAHHTECKDCMEACAECARACDAYAAT